MTPYPTPPVNQADRDAEPTLAEMLTEAAIFDLKRTADNLDALRARLGQDGLSMDEWNALVSAAHDHRVEAWRRGKGGSLEMVRLNALEEAARFIEGHGGVIPGASMFAPLVSGNNQPCMSGDPRDRLNAFKRREFDSATSALAAAIRALGGQP